MSGRQADRHHHMSNEPVYNVWRAMRQRCLNPDHKHFSYYGGRGIVICERWSDFGHFLEDMGFPDTGDTIDRIDNNGPYCKENCRWASRQAQVMNRRNNVWFYLDGEKVSLADASVRLGLHKEALRGRMRRGWTKAEVENALRETA